MKLSMSVFLSFFLIFMACSDDDDNDDVTNAGCGQNWIEIEEVETALNAFSDAANAYGMNQTAENCQAFKDAGNEYVDVLESIRTCAVNQGLLDEWQRNIDETRSSLETVC